MHEAMHGTLIGFVLDEIHIRRPFLHSPARNDLRLACPLWLQRTNQRPYRLSSQIGHDCRSLTTLPRFQDDSAQQA